MTTGASLTRIVSVLEAFAPIKYAESWDNVGLLIEPYRKPLNVKKIMLTNDLTEPVMQEAIEKSADMIIAYHPPIFTPLKRIVQCDWKQRIISLCLAESIAVYSPHTAWDVVPGGINEWLACALPYKNMTPIRLLSNSSESNVGLGRIFSTNLILEEAIAAVQKHIGLDVHVALGNQHTLKSKIITVAVCAGSGSSLLRGIKADLYITGEMSHHELIEANQNNISVILCNHSNSERGFLKSFKMKLEAILKNDCEVIISDKDADPLVTFPKTELKSQIEIS